MADGIFGQKQNPQTPIYRHLWEYDVVTSTGIERVIVRDDKENFRVINVSEWVENDESLSGVFGY